MTRKGFSHSETSGSKPICGSPKHIAAYRVLHRLLTPSHPPQTLRSLTLMFILESTIPVFRQDCIDVAMDVYATSMDFEDVRLPL